MGAIAEPGSWQLRPVPARVQLGSPLLGPVLVLLTETRLLLGQDAADGDTAANGDGAGAGAVGIATAGAGTGAGVAVVDDRDTVGGLMEP